MTEKLKKLREKSAEAFKKALSFCIKAWTVSRTWFEKNALPFLKKAWRCCMEAVRFIKRMAKEKPTHCAAAVLASSVVFVFAVLGLSAKEVRIIDGNTISTIYTISQNPENILNQHGIEVTPYDNVQLFGSFENGNADIVISRAFPVSLSVDGNTHSFYLNSGTVSSVLDLAGVTLGEDDLINISPDEAIVGQTDIVINRVTFENEVLKETIPYTINQRGSPLILKRGRVVVISAGQNGEKEVTVKRKMIDGVEVTREVIGEKVLTNPVEEVSLIGIDTSTPVSPYSLPAGITLDANGVPSSYKAVYEGKATAYTAPKGALTYSGRYAVVGNVATHKTDIPMGSKLYIVGSGPNTGFVYGSAVAADTGAAVMQRRVLVDLFFETYKESCWFGVKQVKVYVLE